MYVLRYVFDEYWTFLLLLSRNVCGDILYMYAK